MAIYRVTFTVDVDSADSPAAAAAAALAFQRDADTVITAGVQEERKPGVFGPKVEVFL